MTNQLAQFSGQTPAPNQSALALAIQSRESSEVLAACMIARQFPRDEIAALGRISRSCARPKLAEMAEYGYKKGNSIVGGPSIRLAESIAQAWGNMDHGWRELERRPHAQKKCLSSTVQSYAWDLETNNRKTLVFEVPHWRDTTGGGYALSEERDIYELCANMAARRIRACILALIPGDIVDEAQEAARRTLEKEHGAEPLADRIRSMAVAFQNSFGVSRKQIEARLQHKIEATTEPEMIALKRTFAGLRDGMSSVATEFPEPKAPSEPVDPFAGANDSPTPQEEPEPQPEPEPEKQPSPDSNPYANDDSLI